MLFFLALIHGPGCLQTHRQKQIWSFEVFSTFERFRGYLLLGLTPGLPPKLGQFTDSVRIYRPRLGKSWPQCAPSNKWHQLSKGYLITRRTPTENLRGLKQLNIVRKYVEDQSVWTSRLSSKRGVFVLKLKRRFPLWWSFLATGRTSV